MKAAGDQCARPLDPVGAITVDGGPQPTGGADELVFNAGDIYASNQQGQIQVDGHPTVHYSGIEVINVITMAFKSFLAFITR